MQRRYEKMYSLAVGREMQLLAYGHQGEAVVAFPSGGGAFFDFENNGMVDAIANLIETGKMRMYTIEGVDHESWLNNDADPHWRGYRHNAYQDYILEDLVPFIQQDCDNPDVKIATVGCSIGAYHAANFTLKFPEIFHHALCLSGRYDIEELCGRSSSLDVYYNNPLAYLPNLEGEALENVRANAHLTLVCGQGAWEGKCLRETHRLADLLAAKGISHERDIWGFDVEHHWYWWRRQIAHHFRIALGE